jgi:putative endonuclease
VTNYAAGHNAEKVAAEYLKGLKYKILKVNWSTRYCEIDIVAEKNKRIYFVEVKYRSRDKWGGGLDYINKQKLDKMRFAAEMWVNDHKWSHDYQLAAMELSGQPAEITNFLIDL